MTLLPVTVTTPLAPRALTEGAEAPNFCFPVGQKEASAAPGLGEGTARPNRVRYPLPPGPVSCSLHVRTQGRQEQVTQPEGHSARPPTTEPAGQGAQALARPE